MPDSINITIHQNRNREVFVFFLLFLCLWFILPIISIFIFLALQYIFKFNRKVELFLFILIAASLGLIGYTTQSVGTKETDIARYYTLYESMVQITNAKQFALYFILDGGNNVLFYITTFLMTRLFPENPQVMPLFWVTFTYFFSFLTIKECVLYLYPDDRRKYITVIFFAVAGIITFFTVTEILKQVASVSLLSYAIIRKLKSKKQTWILVLLALLIHFSSMLLLPVYFLCTKRYLLKYMPILFFVSLVLSFFNFNILLYSIASPILGRGDLLHRIEAYEEIETWTISFRYYAVFAMYFILVSLLYCDYFLTVDNKEKTRKRHFLIMHSLAFFILLVNRSNVHNFLRYLMGYFPFYIIAVIQLLRMRISAYSRITLVGFVVCFYIYSNAKLLMTQTVVGGDYSDSYMDNNIVKILTSNVVTFLQFRVKHS